MDLFIQFTNSEFGVFIAFLCTVFGFAMTIWVWVRTNKISKVLRHNELTPRYNEERKHYQERFRGYRNTIDEDNIKTRSFISTIRESINCFHIQYKTLLSFTIRVKILYLNHYLQQDYNKIKINKISNSLTDIISYLEKEENLNHGQ